MTTTEQDGWQPIETAPKDGTVIDLWMIDERGNVWRETDAYYVENRTAYPNNPWQDGGVRRDGWYSPNHDYDGADGWCDDPKESNYTGFMKPTHWRPLPPPPQGA